MSETANLKGVKVSVADQGKEVAISTFFDLIDSAFKGFIYGLLLEWVSASSIKVKKGIAVLPGGGLIVVTSDITVSSISLGNNAWGHIYLYNSSTFPTVSAAVEVVADTVGPPSTRPLLYFGHAYQKTSDATRRYLGSVRTDGSGNVRKFKHEGNNFFYLEDTSAAPYRVLSAGTATTETNVDASAVVPATSNAALITAINTSTNAVLLVGNADDVSANGLLQVPAVQRFPEKHPLTSSQTLSYKFDTAPSGGAGYIDIRGYELNR